MDMDFGKFYDYLMESGDSNGSNSGKTFKDIATGWYYIPHPTNGKDFGQKGKGQGEYKLLVRESGNTWDMFVLGRTSTAATAGRDEKVYDKMAQKISKGMDRASASRTVNSDMNMERLMALSESYFSGKLNEQVLNEVTGGDEDHGDTSMLNDTVYHVVKEIVGMPFEKILKLCVTAVTGEPVQGGEGSELLSALK